MRGKFAHISDCHIGAWRDPKLRDMNDAAFGKAIDLCKQNQVDFVVISGDIFDIGIPEMASVRSAVRKLKELVDYGTPVYVVYGSHDYSPTTVSVVEVLTEAGLFANVGEFDESHLEDKESLVNREYPSPEDEKEARRKEQRKMEVVLSLRPIVDEKTKVQLAGLPARRGGLEREYYTRLKGGVSQNLDQSNYSIFVFHAAVNELQSLTIPVEQNVSLEDLPRGFSYYAGGHIHKRSQGKIGESPVVYPGPLFGTSYSDLELTAKAEKRGFALVEFQGNKTESIKFVDLPSPRVLSRSFSGEGKSSSQIDAEIKEFISKGTLDVGGSIVLLRVKGMLSSGKPSDIDWYEYRTLLLDRGAIVASINRMGLSTKETRKLEMIGRGTKEEIESKLLAEHVSTFKSENPDLLFLSSTSGVTKAARLLGALKTERREEENRSTFEKRVISEASGILGNLID